MARGWVLLLVGLVVVAGWEGALARPAAAQNELSQPPFVRDSFAFAGGSLERPRGVHFQPRPDRSRGQWVVARRGRLFVRLRNRTRLGGALRVRFFPQHAGHVIELTGPEGATDGLVRLAGSRRPRIEARDYTTLELVFTLGPRDPVSRADGLLVAQLEVRKHRGPLARTRVRGVAPQVSFAPALAHLDVERWCVLGCSNEGHVVLRGDDAAQLLGERDVLGAATLRSEDGEEVRVVVEPPSEVDAVPRATVRVTPGDFGEVGTYEGEVPLAIGRDGQPALGLRVDVGYGLLAAGLAVFAGSLLALFFLRRMGARREATLLRLKVRRAVREYDEERKRTARERPAHEVPAAYDLEDWLEPRERLYLGTHPFPGSRGVGPLMWDLRMARTEEDLQDLRPRAQTVVDQIDRWLRLEPVAREALGVLDAWAREEQGGLGRAPYDELAALVQDARVAPPWAIEDRDEFVEAGDRVVGDLKRQIAFMLRVLALSGLHDRLARLESRPEGMQAELAKLRATLTEVSAVRDGPIDESARRDADRRLEHHARKLIAAASSQAPHRTYALLAAPVGSRWTVEEALHEARRYDHLAGERAKRADKLSVVGLVSLNAVRTLDWIWTLIRVLVAVAVYALTFHHETWGSLADFVTAFGAGFLTQGIIDWAALPVLHSLHPGRRARPGDPAPVAEPRRRRRRRRSVLRHAARR